MPQHLSSPAPAFTRHTLSFAASALLCVLGVAAHAQAPAEAVHNTTLSAKADSAAQPGAPLAANSAVALANHSEPAAEQRAVVAPVADEPAAVTTPVPQGAQALLALQRDGQLASPVQRPLEGEIAQRSRQRYLKSFEYAIPERFQSSVTQKSSER